MTSTYIHADLKASKDGQQKEPDTEHHPREGELHAMQQPLAADKVSLESWLKFKVQATPKRDPLENGRVWHDASAGANNAAAADAAVRHV